MTWKLAGAGIGAAFAAFIWWLLPDDPQRPGLALTMLSGAAGGYLGGLRKVSLAPLESEGGSPDGNGHRMKRSAPTLRQCATTETTDD